MARIENRNDVDSKYFSAVEDGREVGEASYYLSPGRITITHVGVDYEHRGSGLATKLVMAAVDYARENELSVVPICSYARTVFKRHPEIRDVLDTETERVL
ncbi:MAG: N-acetyltransferase [Rikenellaceae bacterium]|nr:N-acetyltransferase [Rikenellaceae bacterium]